MPDSPETRPSLLIRIRSPQNNEAWTEFVDLYAPLIYAYARKRGLQDPDAADITQDVLSAVARSIARWQYDPRRGSFRGWLFTVTQSKLVNFWEARERQPRGTGEDDTFQRLREHPDKQQDLQDAWDRAHDEHLFSWASERVRERVEPKTWQAFRSTAIEGRRAKDVADELGLSVAAVRLAKSRVMAQIKKCIEGLQLE